MTSPRSERHLNFSAFTTAQFQSVVMGGVTATLSNPPALEEIVRYHVEPLRVPAFMGASIGHTTQKLTVPIGVEAEMDANGGNDPSPRTGRSLVSDPAATPPRYS
ncbi:hypothetical protein [Rubrivirga sp.]|uniref:hypothetical protein n=1 Tax=Rubrivirga sp. TaxID=1885344 RepID=UPI003C7501B4